MSVVSKILNFINTDGPEKYTHIGPVKVTRERDGDDNYCVTIEHNGAYLQFETDGCGNVVMKEASCIWNSDIVENVYHDFDGLKDDSCYDVY